MPRRRPAAAPPRRARLARLATQSLALVLAWAVALCASAPAGALGSTRAPAGWEARALAGLSAIKASRRSSHAERVEALASPPAKVRAGAQQSPWSPPVAVPASFELRVPAAVLVGALPPPRVLVPPSHAHVVAPRARGPPVTEIA